MGLVNNRAICPNCGGKIHTQARGVGGALPFRSGMLVQTGRQCQHCGVALSGRVGVNNHAILAETADAKREAKEQAQRERAEQVHQAATRPMPEPTAEDIRKQRELHQRAHDRYQQDAERRRAKATLDQRLLALLAEGPVTVRDAAKSLDASTMDIIGAQTRLGRKVTASGIGKKRTLRLR